MQFPLTPLLHVHPPPIHSSITLQKNQVTLWYKTNMHINLQYDLVHPFILSNSVGGNSHKSRQESETVPPPTVRRHTKTSSYEMIIDMQIYLRHIWAL